MFSLQRISSSESKCDFLQCVHYLTGWRAPESGVNDPVSLLLNNVSIHHYRSDSLCSVPPSLCLPVFTAATSCLRTISLSVWFSKLNRSKHLCLFSWFSALFLFICTFCLFVYKSFSVSRRGRCCSTFLRLLNSCKSLLKGHIGQYSSSSSYLFSLSHPILPFRLCHASLYIQSSLHPSGQPLKCKVQLMVEQEENGNLRLTSGENSQEELCYFSVLHNQMCLQLLCVNNGSTDAHWWFQKVPHGLQADHPI